MGSRREGGRRLTERFVMEGVVEEKGWREEADREVWLGRESVVVGEE